MRQVLFTIPVFGGLKVFGYGAMLVLAFVGSTWAATSAPGEKSSTPTSSWTWLSGSSSSVWSEPGSFTASSTGGTASTTGSMCFNTGRGVLSTMAALWAGRSLFSCIATSGRFPFGLTWMSSRLPS